MSIGVVSVEYLIENVAERWLHQYKTYTLGFPEWRLIYERLKALPPHATPEMVTAIIGNDSWVRLVCDECHKRVERVVCIHPENADGMVYLCVDCLRSALGELEQVESARSK